MNFQDAQLPKGSVKIGSTPVMDEQTVKPAILQKHLTPKGKYGYLIVEEGHLQYVWEDEAGPAIDSILGHPIVIFPERYHHVKLIGPVKFKIEFYSIFDAVIQVKHEKETRRPGEAFL